MKKYLIYISFFLLLACNSKIDKDKAINLLPQTTIEIEDPVRHYYPIIRGESLKTYFKYYNTGKNSLIIKEVTTSCGCTVAGYARTPIPPEKHGIIEVEYNSGKNLGLVEVYIDIYANLDTIFKKTIKFDINVVTSADYVRDYEEVYRDYLKEQKTEAIIKGLSGELKKHDYYTDDNAIHF